MTLKELEQKVSEAEESHWVAITCWGAGSGPSYLSNFNNMVAGLASDLFEFEIQSHRMVASLKSDIGITIAWGLEHNPQFKEEWLSQFPDHSATSEFVDFFYHGALVFRDLCVSVDGGRCRLPLPEREFDESHKVKTLTVPRSKYEFFKTLDGLEKVSDFDHYFESAGFTIVNAPWME